MTLRWVMPYQKCDILENWSITSADLLRKKKQNKKTQANKQFMVNTLIAAGNPEQKLKSYNK